MGMCWLEINVISGSNLKNVNFFMQMDVYVVVTLINGTCAIQQQTQVSNGHTNPSWSRRNMAAMGVHESHIQNNTVVFTLYSKRILGNKIIGIVSIPLTELLENAPGSETEEQIVKYQVRSIKGKPRGTLTFSQRFKRC